MIASLMTPSCVETKLRELQTFLENFSRVGRQRAEDFATDFGPVRDRDAKGDQGVAHEDRVDQRDIGVVRASAVRRIGHVDIAGAHLRDWLFGENRFDLRCERSGEEAESVVLGDHAAGGVADAAGKIEDFVDDRTHAGPREHNAHLGCDRQELVPDDFARKRGRRGSAAPRLESSYASYFQVVNFEIPIEKIIPNRRIPGCAW